jgi:radical SAM superfamily enzyme YgiQ (UPF0313 family)
MNILLLYPRMPDTFWSMQHFMKMISKKSSYPPLGLLTVARLLPDNWNKKLIDLNVSPLDPAAVLWADYIFVSAMNVQRKYAREAILECKKYGKKVVAGGPLFTHEHEDFPEADHFVLNEAEITLPLFVSDIENGTPKRIYSSTEFADMSKAVLPDWSLINLKKYAYAIVQYSRGCPYMCDFCDVTTLFGRRPRTKTAQQIISELDEILRHGYPAMILFADDNLIGNRRDLKNNLLPELIKWRRAHKTAPGFATQVTINLADDNEMMQLMIDAGFRNIFVGIESTNIESLEACRKTQNLKRSIFDDVQMLQKKGFIVTGGFIVGFDSDKETIFDQQIDFIQESGIVMATVNVLKAPPGTELYNRMKSENRLIDDFDFNENKTNIVTKMDTLVLYNGYKKILDAIYDPQKIYERAKNFLLEYGNFQSENPLQRKFLFEDVVALLKTIYFAGIVEKGRVYFWRLLIETSIRKKKNFTGALLFGALMYQFHNLHKNFIESYKQVLASHRKAA